MRQLALVVLLALTCACNRSGSPAPADATSPAQAPAVAEPPKPVPAVLPDVLARVNGENITKAEFEEAIGSLEQRNQAPVPPDQRDAVYRGVLDQLVAANYLGIKTGEGFYKYTPGNKELIVSERFASI